MSERESPRPPVVGVAFLVSQVGAHAADRFSDHLGSMGLTPRHAGILRMIGANRGISQRSLSQLLGIFASRLVRLLDELESKELIERRTQPYDRRTYGLLLTAKGQRALTKVGEVTKALEDHIFAALSPSEVDQLVDMLERVVREQALPAGVHSAFRRDWRDGAGIHD